MRAKSILVLTAMIISQAVLAKDGFYMEVSQAHTTNCFRIGIRTVLTPDPEDYVDLNYKVYDKFANLIINEGDGPFTLEEGAPPTIVNQSWSINPDNKPFTIEVFAEGSQEGAYQQLNGLYPETEFGDCD